MDRRRKYGLQAAIATKFKQTRSGDWIRKFDGPRLIGDAVQVVRSGPASSPEYRRRRWQDFWGECDRFGTIEIGIGETTARFPKNDPDVFHAVEIFGSVVFCDPQFWPVANLWSLFARGDAHGR